MSNTNRQLGAAEIFAGITAALALAFPIATLFAAFTWRWRRDKARDLSSKRREVMITVASFGVALTFFSGAYSSGWSSVAHFVIGGHAEHSLFVALILMVPLSVPVGLIAGALGRDFYIWQRKRHPIHGRSIRELEAKRDRTHRAQLATTGDIPLVVDGNPILGVTLNTNRDKTDQLTVIPEAASHIVAIGASGAGKTQSILRIIAAHMQMGWRVIVIDAKEDYGTGAVFADIARNNGVSRLRTKVWPAAGPVDLFRGPPSAIRDRLMACAPYTEPYYRAVAGTILTLVSSATHKPTNFDDVLKSLDHTALKAMWAGTPNAAVAAGLVPSDVQGVRYRYFDLGSQLVSMGAVAYVPGGWSWEDCDAAWITLPTSTRTEAAAAFGRALLVDLISFIRDKERRDDRPILLVVEEMGAIVSGDPETARLVVEAFERARSAQVRTIVSVQTPDGLGPPDMQNRILGSGAAVLCHRMPMPEIVCNLLGTTYGLEASLGVNRAGDLLDAGSLREQSQFVLPPDLIRQLPVGHAVFIHGHHWCHVAVPRAHMAGT